MNLAKSYEFFQPEKADGRCHIIGCGSVGATVAELLVRAGITNLVLYDFDIVEAHNIANQIYTEEDVGRPKIEALADYLVKINHELKDTIKLCPKGYVSQKLSGYVFLCVDNIELRRKIAEDNKFNKHIKAMFDFRTRLLDAQHYAADWSNDKLISDFIGTMQFSHDEAKKETPVSACNIELSVAPTVRMICCAGVANFMNFCNGQQLKKMILIDAFHFTLDAI